MCLICVWIDMNVNKWSFQLIVSLQVSIFTTGKYIYVKLFVVFVHYVKLIFSMLQTMLCISLCTLQNYQIKAATEHFKGILPSKTLSKDTTGMFVWQDFDLCSVLLAADWLEYWWTAWRYCSDWLNKDPGRFCWLNTDSSESQGQFLV